MTTNLDLTKQLNPKLLMTEEEYQAFRQHIQQTDEHWCKFIKRIVCQEIQHLSDTSWQNGLALREAFADMTRCWAKPLVSKNRLLDICICLRCLTPFSFEELQQDKYPEATVPLSCPECGFQPHRATSGD